ncbi:MAG: 50S ribosomal protein L22 [Phycisphaerales bacterium]|nr:50S ribosomal protein L22 [Phycisphaerales bacterium]
MKINGTKLTAVAAAKGATVEQLAQAVERTGLVGDRAVSAVGNWMRGSDHPRCKREDIVALSSALQVPVSAITTFQCIFKFHRGSPRKAKLLVDLIRNKNVVVAENLLTFTTKRAALDIKKALLAARDEATANQADPERLFVSVSTVADGPRMKRFQPKDRGRAHPIIKRMAHITIGLEERN